MKRFVVLAITAALVVGLMGPADARKKKKKPPVPVVVDQKFFLRTDDCESFRLSLVDGADMVGCGFFDGPVAQEVFGGIIGYLPEIWTSEDGVPFILDTSGPVTGQIVTEGEMGLVGAGQSTVDITLNATIAGEVVTLGTASATNPVVPGDKKVVTFEMTLDPALQGVTVEALELQTVLRGPALGHGYYQLDDPASFFVIKALK